MEPDEESKKYQIPLPENISFTYSNNFPGIFELLFKNVSNSWEDLQCLIITRSTNNKVSFYEEVI